MTLEDLFGDISFAPATQPTAFLTITSGPHEGIYPLSLSYTDLTTHPPKGSVAVDIRVRSELRGSYTLTAPSRSPISPMTADTLDLVITRTAPKLFLSDTETGAFDVTLTYNPKKAFRPVRTVDLAKFKVDLGASRDSPCQASAAYFQSLESPTHLVQCCILSNLGGAS